MNNHKLGCPRSDEYSEGDCTCTPTQTTETRFREKFPVIYTGTEEGGYDALPYVLSFIEEEKERAIHEATMVCNEKVIPQAVAQAKREAREETLKKVETVLKIGAYNESFHTWMVKEGYTPGYADMKIEDIMDDIKKPLSTEGEK